MTAALVFALLATAPPPAGGDARTAAAGPQPAAAPVAPSIPLPLPAGDRASPATSAPPAPQLTVRISGLRNDRGQIGVTLYHDSGAKGFPTKPELAVRRAVVYARGGAALASFDGLPPGTYAVAVIHDENSNNDLDLKWYGAPDEGTGASNDPKPTLGPPSFEQARFWLGPGPQVLTITMLYF